jgi:hypothetical protein
MKNIKLISILSSIVLLFSCERTATVDVPQVDPMPVMFSFISPESEYTAVTITKSVPIFGKSSHGEFEVIKNAEVTINDNNGASAQMIYDGLSKSYKIDQSAFPINPGLTYYIVAKFPGYELKASTTVPNDAVYLSEVTSEKLVSDPNGGQKYLLRTKWVDRPGIVNYYRVNLEELVSHNQSDTNGFSIGDQVHSDYQRDGQVISDKYEYYEYDFGGNNTGFNVYLLNTDIHYYEYHKRRLNYYGDDFFSEPIQQYSNVIGGLGVVCSYRKTSIYHKL